MKLTKTILKNMHDDADMIDARIKRGSRLHWVEIPEGDSTKEEVNDVLNAWVKVLKFIQMKLRRGI